MKNCLKGIKVGDQEQNSQPQVHFKRWLDCSFLQGDDMEIKNWLI